MVDNMDKNGNLNKYVWYESFSFLRGEDPPEEKSTTLAREFAKEFGCLENQLLVFRANDVADVSFPAIVVGRPRASYRDKDQGTLPIISLRFYFSSILVTHN